MWLIDQLYIKLGLSPFVVLSRPGVPPVLVLNKMFPDLPRKTAETLSIIEYEELLVASKTALEERELALNASAATRITTVMDFLKFNLEFSFSFSGFSIFRSGPGFQIWVSNLIFTSYFSFNLFLSNYWLLVFGFLQGSAVKLRGLNFFLS